MNNEPKISLAIDNCFLSKRYTKPADWMSIIRNMGLRRVEASADTECDPLYHGGDYLREWVDATKRAEAETGVKVVNMYSGHGTYSTLGLAHWSASARKRLRDRWMKVHADTAGQLNAGLGFFAHAVDTKELQTKSLYDSAYKRLTDELADIFSYCNKIGVEAGLEQMYSPHQPPFTVASAKEMMRGIYREGAPMYITLDTGHMCMQSNFLGPTEQSLFGDIEKGRAYSGWLGTEKAVSMYNDAISGKRKASAAVADILTELSDKDYLFAEPQDAEYEYWISELAPYSPIVHLQQTYGNSSSHLSFTKETFEKGGIVTAEKVLSAIAKSYEKSIEPEMSARVKHINLTLEPFIGTGSNIYRALSEITESVTYWRKYIPHDEMPLSDVIDNIKNDTQD